MKKLSAEAILAEDTKEMAKPRIAKRARGAGRDANWFSRVDVAGRFRSPTQQLGDGSKKIGHSYSLR